MSRNQYMNPSNVYWSPPQYTTTSLKPISGNLGFLMNLPYPDPVSTSFYYGEGSENIYGKRELVYSTFPEMYAVGNVMPMTAGIPRVDTRGILTTHSREKYTVQDYYENNEFGRNA